MSKAMRKDTKKGRKAMMHGKAATMEPAGAAMVSAPAHDMEGKGSTSKKLLTLKNPKNRHMVSAPGPTASNSTHQPL